MYRLSSSHGATTGILLSLSFLIYRIEILKKIIYFAGLHCCVGFSLLVGSRDYSLVAVQASHCGASPQGAQALGCLGAVVAALGL